MVFLFECEVQLVEEYNIDIILKIPIVLIFDILIEKLSSK